MPTTKQPNNIDPKKPVVALTFDDGPSIHTTRILDTLQKYEARATFFVMGKKVTENKGKILRVQHMECEIVCHAWDHTDLTTLSGRAIKKQLFDTIAAIATVTGTASLIYRPPYGNINKKVKKVSRNLGLAMVNWSLNAKDMETKDADAIYNNIESNLKNEDIILCHDILEPTAEAMTRIIPDLVEQGCQLVTVTELLHHKYGEIKPGKLYLN